MGSVETGCLSYIRRIDSATIEAPGKKGEIEALEPLAVERLYEAIQGSEEKS